MFEIYKFNCMFVDVAVLAPSSLPHVSVSHHSSGSRLVHRYQPHQVCCQMS